MDQTQILDPAFFATAASTASTTGAATSSIITSTTPNGQMHYNNLQQHPTAGFAPQQYVQQPYQNIGFFYETPHIQPTASVSSSYSNITPTPSTSYQTPMSNNNNTIKLPDTATTTTTTNATQMDEDYVQNLANELQHTKQLLGQYQLRTEQLMELVKKQTDKIAELREQLANKSQT